MLALPYAANPQNPQIPALGVPIKVQALQMVLTKN